MLDIEWTGSSFIIKGESGSDDLILPKRIMVAADVYKNDSYHEEHEWVLTGEGPDFIVQSISLDPSVFAPNGTVTATIKVKNQGNISGDAGYLDWWADRSSAPTDDSGSTAYVSVGTLGADSTKTYTKQFTAPGTTGSKTFWAFIDSTDRTTELADYNNTKSASYTVQEPPDFIVHSISLSPTPPVQGEEVTAKVQVMNQGGSSGDGGYLDVWYDKPSAASVGEDGDDYDNVGTIYAGAIFYYTYTFTASGSGTKTFRAFIDSYNETSEGNENNNQQTKTYTVLPAYLNVSPTSVSVPQGGGSGTFTISANVSWSVSDNADWLTVSPASGSGDKQVTVTASANTGTSDRNATVTVTGDGLSRTVTVSQPGDSLRPVYRFWSPVFSAHFYTNSEREKDKVINTLSQYWDMALIPF